MKGRHLLVECYGTPFEALDDLELVRTAMRAAVEKMGAKYLGEFFHKFEPQGVTGVIVVAESHLSIHTWPEDGYAAIDFFTCGEINPREGLWHFAKALGASEMKLVEMSRGNEHFAEQVERQKFDLTPLTISTAG